MLRILHTADLHLDAQFPSLGEKALQRREDFLKTFERIVTLAIKNEVHLLLVAGDLFDSPRPSGQTLGRVQAGFKRLLDRGILPVLLPGTHDNLVSSESIYRRHAFPGAVVLDAPLVQEPVAVSVAGQQVFLYGFAYRSSVSDQALAGMQRRPGEGVHIGLLHGSRQGSPEWEYRKKDLPFTLPGLKHWGLDYVALGHYHNFELLQDGGRIWACYPGSPEGKRFGENGPRHCALVSITQGKVSVEPVAVQTRMLEEHALELAGCETSEAAVNAITALANPNLLLRLTLSGIVEAPLALDQLQGRCGGEFYHLDLVDRTRLFDSDFARRIAAEETVRGLFVRRLQARMVQAQVAERLVLEEAFREVLVRFHAFEGGAA